MLVLRTLTVKMTVRVWAAATDALQINSLEGSLMIEWGVGFDLSRSIAGMPLSLTVNVTVR
jgi:hypothetical protein